MKKILIAPLNWGLGHATRCIPIIEKMLENSFEPIIASDGDALTLLQKEFPQLQSYKLPSYHIQYSKGKNLKYKLLLSTPNILRAIRKEKKITATIVQKEQLSGIISDNRFGVRNSTVPSVYITHQLQVLSGKTTAITTALHQQIIAKFDACWIPDTQQQPNLSGKLSETHAAKLNIKFVGALSRLKKQKLQKKYELLIVLSGPEPQRTLLEQKLLKQLKAYTKKALMVRGVFTESIPVNISNTTVVNYLLSDDLQKAINQSNIVLARSGYSTLLDLQKLEKKAFFIPTPGQFEQEYLAQHIESLQIAPYATQDKFELKMLDRINNFKGFSNTDSNFDEGLLHLF